MWASALTLRVEREGVMSQLKTTPGPWIVHPAVARVDCQKLSEKGGLLPVCEMLWPTDERTEAETEANAHLIAASPRMYEALEELLESYLDALPGSEDYGPVLEAQAALAKAQGK
jgi:hypothetical protein